MAAVRGSVRAGFVAAALVLLVVGMSACGSSDAPTSTSGGETPSSVTSRGTAPRPDGSSAGTVPGSTVVADGSDPGSSRSTDATTIAPTSVPAGMSPGPPPATVVPAPTRSGVGAVPVVSTTVRLVDASRPTVSRGRQIASTRTLTTVVTYPATGGPYPLVVFAHGYHLGPAHYSHLINTIAAAGYVVAAPSFPLADDAVGGADVDRGDIPNQSGDLTFVISQIVAGAAGPALPAGRVDGTRVGAVGHSDGADTVLDLGYQPGRIDQRVQAVVALAPDPMTGAGAGSVGAAPLLLAHGRSDSIVPYRSSETVFGQVRARRWFVTMVGADHLPPAQGVAPWGPVVDQIAVDLLDHYVAGRTSDDSALLAHSSVSGVASVAAAG